MLAPNVRQVRLAWSGEGLAFRGGPEGGVQIGVDSAGVTGQSPMQLLLMSLAGCMGVDVLMILQKSRVHVESLEVQVTGVRAETAPKRYVSLELVYVVTGPGEDDQDKLDRAIALSRDKYCSVLHTLDPGIEVDTRVQRG
jgi:putative redox protein